MTFSKLTTDNAINLYFFIIILCKNFRESKIFICNAKIIFEKLIFL